MRNDDDRKWLYDTMQSKGVDTGNYDEFCKSLNNKEDRDWYYQKSLEFGLNVGTDKDFTDMMADNTNSPSNGFDNSLKKLRQFAERVGVPNGQSVPTSQAVPTGLPESAQQNDVDTGRTESSGRTEEAVPWGDLMLNVTDGKGVVTPMKRGDYASQLYRDFANVVDGTIPLSEKDDDVLAPKSAWEYIRDKAIKSGADDISEDVNSPVSNDLAMKVYRQYMRNMSQSVAEKVISQLPDHLSANPSEDIASVYYDRGLQDFIREQVKRSGGLENYENIVKDYIKPAIAAAYKKRWGGDFKELLPLYTNLEHVEENVRRREANKVVAPYLGKMVDDAFAVFDKKGAEAYRKTRSENEESSMFVNPEQQGGHILAGIFGAERAKIKASDPGKVREHLEQRVEQLYGDLVKNKNFQKDAIAKAEELGIPVMEYIQSYVLPGFADNLQKKFRETAVAREMPDSDLENILQGITRDSIFGMLFNKLLYSDEQREYQQEAMAKSDRGMWSNVGRMTAGMAADFWLWLASGGIGAKAAQGIIKQRVASVAAKEGISEAAARVVVENEMKKFWTKNMIKNITPRLASSAVTLGGAEATTTAIRGITNEDNVIDVIADTAASAASGGTTGLAFGLTGGMVHPLVERLTGIPKLFGKIGAYEVEAGTMYATGEIHKLLAGEAAFENPLEGMLESNVSLGGIKLAQPHGVAKAWNSLRHPIRTTREAMQPSKEGYFTEDDIKSLESKTDSRNLLEVVKKLGSGEAVAREDVAETATAYDTYMRDKDEPVSRKAKVANLFGKKAPVVGYEVSMEHFFDEDGNYIVRTRDMDGQCVNEYKFKNVEDGEAKETELKNTLYNNEVEALAERVNLWNGQRDLLSWQPQDEEMQRKVLTLNQHAEELVSIAEKQSSNEPLTPDEQKLLNTYWDALAGYVRDGGAYKTFERNYEKQKGLQEGTLEKILKKPSKDYSADERMVVDEYKEALRSELPERKGEDVEDVAVVQQQTGRGQAERGQEEQGLTVENERQVLIDEGRQALLSADSETLRQIDMDVDLAAERVRRLQEQEHPDAEALAAAQEMLSLAEARAYGVRTGLQEMIETQQRAIAEELEPMKSESGMITPVTLHDGRQGFVKAGAIDLDNHYGSLFVTFEKDGEWTTEQVGNNLIREVGESRSFDDMVSERSRAMEEETIARIQRISEGLDVEPGRQVMLTIGDVTAPFEVRGESNGQVVLRDANGEEVTMPRADVDNYIKATRAKEVAERLNIENPTEAETPTKTENPTQTLPEGEGVKDSSDRPDDGGEPPVAGSLQVDMDRLKEMSLDAVRKGEDVETLLNSPGISEEMKEEVRRYVRKEVSKGVKLSEEESSTLLSEMEKNSDIAPEIALTPENWILLFGENGEVKTPIGDVKMGENQYFKLAKQGREGKLGMVKPTLENPDIIIEDPSEPKNGDIAERNSSYVFVKAFKKDDGSRFYYFTSVTVSKDGKEVVISNQEKTPKRISRLLQSGNVVWKNSKFSLHPNTQIGEPVPLNDSNKPTLTDNQSALLGINSSELSESKDNVNLSSVQENGKKIVENSQNVSTEEVAAGSKTAADIFDEIREGYEREKQERLGYINAAKSSNERLRRAEKVYGSDSLTDGIIRDMEPRDAHELAASELRPHSIEWTSLNKELGGMRGGFGHNTDMGSFAYYIGKKDDMPLVGVPPRVRSFNDIVHEIWESRPDHLREISDQDVRNALLDILMSAQKPSDIIQYVLNNRIQEAESALEGIHRSEENAAYEGFIEEFHETPETYRKIIEIDEKEFSSIPEENFTKINSIFAEKYLEEDGQRKESGTPGSLQGMVSTTPSESKEVRGDTTGGREEVSPSITEVHRRHSSHGEEAQRAEGKNESEDSGILPDEGVYGAVDSGTSGGEVEVRSGSFADRLSSAIAETETNPSEGQKKSGNYKKGHLSFGGYDFTIENPKGSVRRGVDATGKSWEQTMNNTYGYLRGKGMLGKDGDHLDVFINDGVDLDTFEGPIFIIDQVNKDGSFDEHKIMYGFDDMPSAIRNYLMNYERPWEGLGNITEVDKATFDKWLESSDRKLKPFAETRFGDSRDVVDKVIGETMKRNERLTRTEIHQREVEAFLNETPEQAVAFDERIKDMSDEDLLDYIRYQGYDETKVDHPNVYDEYDFRHSKEYASEYDAYEKMLSESGTTREQAEDMLVSVMREWKAGGYADAADRTKLSAQMDVLNEFIEKATPTLPEGEEVKGDSGVKPKERIDADGGGAASVVQSSAAKIEDFGEKIGMARKDTSVKGIKKGTGTGEPAWKKKYTLHNLANPDGGAQRMVDLNGLVIGDTDYSKPFIAYYTKKAKSRWGYDRHYPIRDKDGNVMVFRSREEFDSVVPVWEVREQMYRIREKDGKFVITRTASNGKAVEYASFDTREEAEAYMTSPEGATSLLNHKRENFELPALESLTRNGMKDYRQGRNVSGQDMLDTFGFRGGEFGNWVNADERQQFLNTAYDALMDLANLVGVSPRALSLNGELSIAFGARGSKGAKAHYEPSRAVINLTKMNGAGSLAHEWAHALDNYFGMLAKGVQREHGGENSHYISEYVWSSDPKIRKEVLDIFKEIRDAMKRKTVTRDIDIAHATDAEKTLRTSLDKAIADARAEFERGVTKYVYNRKTRKRETQKIVPTEEQLQRFDELMKSLETDVQWKYVPEKDGFRMLGESADALYELMKDVLPNKKGKYGPAHNVGYYISRWKEANDYLERAKNGERETVAIDTKFYGDSKRADAGRAGSYFSTDKELLARAFETYLADKMMESGKSSDYLTYKKGDIFEQLFGINVYPATEEADRLSGLFDKLFSTIEERVVEDTGNVALYEKVGERRPLTEREVVKRDALIDDMKEHRVDIIADEASEKLVDEVNGVRLHNVYHGSGADFDAFDHSHMGEGEGAQAYGYGTYVTEVEGIGKMYAKEATSRKQRSQTPIVYWKGQRIDFSDANPLRMAFDVVDSERTMTIHEARRRAERVLGLVDAEDAEMKGKWQEVVEILRNSNKSDFKRAPVKGNRILYTVEIPDDNGHNYLDWTKTIDKSDRRRIADVVRALEGEPAQSVMFGNYRDGWQSLANMIEKNQWAYQEIRDRLVQAMGGKLSDEQAVTALMRKAGFVGIKYPAEHRSGGRKDGAKNYVIFDESDLTITDKLRFFRTPNGEAYGFTLNGVIHIDPRIATSETPIHEYSHLWVDAMRKSNPEEWESIKKMLRAERAGKLGEIWRQVSENYPELEGNDDALCEEILTHYSGKRGAERLEAEVRRVADSDASPLEKSTVIAGLRRLGEGIRRFWKWVADSFHIHYKDVDEVADRIMSDLAEGRNFKDVKEKERDTSLLSVKEMTPEEKETERRRLTDIIEKPTRIEKLRKSEHANITGKEIDLSGNESERKKSAKLYGRTLQGSYTNEDTGNKIQLQRGRKNGGINEVLQHNYKDIPHLKSVAAIPQIIEKSILISSNANTDKNKNPNISEYQHYVCGLKIGNEDYTVHALVAVDNVGNRYYDHNLVQIGKGKLLDHVNGKAVIEGFGTTPSTKLTTNSERKVNSLLSILQTNPEEIALAESRLRELEGQPMFMKKSQDEKTLMGVHNISEEKLKKALKTGGLANPSLAVIDTRQGMHNDYGAISLIPKSTLIDKRTGRNAGTYSGDAWTPTYPHVERRLTAEGEKHLEELSKAAGGGNKEIENHIWSNLISYIEDNSDRLHFLFLRQKGLNPEIKQQQITHSHEEYEELRKLLGDDFRNIRELTKEQNDALLEIMMKPFEEESKASVADIQEAEKREQTYNVLLKMYREKLVDENGKLFFAKWNTYLDDVARDEYRRNNPKIDWRDTDYDASKRVNEEGLSEEYAQWKETLLNDNDISEVLFAGFTPSGTRKYLPNTAENASRLMNKQSDTNSYGNGGFGATRSQLLQKFSSLKDIRKNKDLIQNDETAAERAKELSDELFDIISQISDLQKISDNQFMNTDYAESRLQEAITKKDPVDYLNKEYGYHIPQDGELASQIKDFIEATQKLPAKYFETKFKRPVGLDEFAIAVVPENTSQEVVKALKDAGLDVRTYDDSDYQTSDENRRQVTMDAVNGRDDIRFRMGDAAETFKERQQRAVKNKGTVMPGLNEVVVKVVDVPRHQYKGHDAITQAYVAAIDRYSKKIEGKKERELKPQHYDNYGVEFNYVISPKSLREAAYHTENSDNIGVHIAVMDKLHEVINNSIEIEEHPDVNKKDGERKWENGFNEDVLMHRFAGVVEIDGIIYRVKTTMKEYEKPQIANGHYTYEVTKIEVLDEKSNTSNGRSNVSNVFVSGAKLLQNVEKSYENGKKVLDASKEADKTTMPKPLNNEDRSAAVEAARGVGEQLGGIGVEVVLNGEATDADKTLTEEQRVAKGWYDPSTGKVYLNASRIESAEDAVRTVLHEKAGHEGLSALLGGQEGVDRWGDFIFKSADKELRRRMVERADAEGYSMADRLRWSKAAQEVFADIAMEGPKTAEEFSLWRKAKHYIIKALKALGIRVRGMVTDEDLRYYVMKTVDALRKGGKKPTLNPSQREGLETGSEDLRFNRMPGTPARMEGESDARYFARLREWDKEKQREKWQQEVDNIDSDKILEEYRQQYEQDLQEWRTRYHIAEDATEPVVPDTSSMNMWDATRAMAEYRRQEAVWKTVPKLEDYIARANDEYVARKANIDLILHPGDRAAKLRTISANLQQIRRAMGRQRRYDKKTVDAVVSLAREYLKSGYGDNLGRGDIGRLLSAVRNATGSKDLRPEIDKIVNIMIDSQLRSCESNLWKLANIKEIRRKAVGTGEINVQGKLELRGQRAIQSFRRAIEHRMTEEEIAHRLEELSEKMTNDKEGAVMYEDEYNGLSMALQYVNQIDESRKELEDLKRSRRDAEKDYGNSGRDYNQQKELLEAIDDAMLENRTERIGLYADLYNRLSQTVTKSIEGAKTFIEQEKQRVKHIQDIVNWDLSGKDASAFHSNNRLKRLNNSAFPRFFLGPTATFEQMMKQFGGRNSNGEGYLYKHFVNKYIDSTENEWTGKQDAYKRLDEKAREWFGESIKRFSDLYALDRKQEGVEVTFIDNNEKKTVKLSQGNLLYIYMANKMTDGKMKLRSMGITEEDVNNIKKSIDSRFVKLGDWIQDVFLQESRKKYNQLHEKLFGAPMEAIDNYFPLKILKDSIFQQVDVGSPDNADTFLPSTTTGAIIRRRRNSLPLDIVNADALSMTIEHIDQMEKWAAFAEFNKDVNALLSYNKFRNMVKNMNTVYGTGDILLKDFENVAKIAAGTYRPKVHDKTSVDAATNNLAKGVTTAKISFRVFTAMKQILSAPAFLHDVDMRYFAKNSVNPYGSFKWAIENMPIFEKRWKSRQLGDTRLMDDPTDWKMWKEGIVGLAARWGMTPNGLVDAITCAVGARSIYESRYNKYIKYGYDKEKAHEKALGDAKIGYNLTQQSSEGAFVSSIQKDRTFAANVLSVFRNSSMSYTRQTIDALRNLKHRRVKGYKEDAIRFMTGQFMEDGLSEEQARLAALAEYKRDGRRNLAKLGVTAFLLPMAWNLGGVVGYLILGDDDKLKEKTMIDALVKGLLAGPIEGLTAGSIISDMIGLTSSEGFSLSGLKNYDINPSPFLSDLQKTVNDFSYDVWAGIQDMVNIAVQSAVGFNPETVTNIINAAIDYSRGDMTNAKEITLFITRVLNFPQSGTTDNLYIDELGMNASEAKKLNYDEMAKRYADYKFSKNAPLVGWLYDDAIRNKKKATLMKRFDEKVSEHIARLDDAALARNYDNTNNANYKKLLSKEVAKRTGEEDKILKNINKYEYDKKYILQRQYKDILEDLEIEKIDRSSSQEEIKDIIKWYKDDVRDLKKELLENERPPEEIMNDIRLMRKELLEELRKL